MNDFPPVRFAALEKRKPGWNFLLNVSKPAGLFCCEGKTMNDMEMVHKAREVANYWSNIADIVTFSGQCCDAAEDRMWRASDGEWLRRVGNEFVTADPPKGWVKAETL